MRHSFIPQQDQGDLINIIQPPPGAPPRAPTRWRGRVNKMVLDTPGVAHTAPIVGLDGATFTNAPNAAAIFSLLAAFDERAKDGPTATKISMLLIDKFQTAAGGSRRACRHHRCAASVPPAATSSKTEDTDGGDLVQLKGVAQSVVAAANQTPGLTSIFTTFKHRTAEDLGRY